MTCSNPECHTDTPGWHKGRGLTHTGPAVLAGHVGVNALTLEATLGVLTARGCVAGGVHFVFTLVDVCTHDGRSVASPLAPPQEATPPRACLSSGAGGRRPRPAPSLTATRPVTPHLVWGRPLGQGPGGSDHAGRWALLRCRDGLPGRRWHLGSAHPKPQRPAPRSTLGPRLRKCWLCSGSQVLPPGPEGGGAK